MKKVFSPRFFKKERFFDSIRSGITNPWVVAVSAIACYLLLPEAVLAQATEPWEGAYGGEAFADGEIQEVYCDLVGLLQGSFGALIATSAVVLAVGSAAFSDTKHGTTLIMVAIGAVTISAGVSLYFGDFGCGTQAATPLPATGGPMGGFVGGVNPANVARKAPGFSDAEIAIARGENAGVSFAVPAESEAASDEKDIFDHDFSEEGEDF